MSVKVEKSVSAQFPPGAIRYADLVGLMMEVPEVERPLALFQVKKDPGGGTPTDPGGSVRLEFRWIDGEGVRDA